MNMHTPIEIRQQNGWVGIDAARGLIICWFCHRPLSTVKAVSFTQWPFFRADTNNRRKHPEFDVFYPSSRVKGRYFPEKPRKVTEK